MKKILLVILVLALFGCQETGQEVVNEPLVGETNQVEEQVGETEEVNETEITTVDWYGFADKDQAVAILAADDDYTTKLSQFDYASKFKSDKALDIDERASVYADLVLEWSDEQKAVIDKAMVGVNERLAKLKIEIPEIEFILTSPEDEGGAAYTRANMIILKPRHVKSHSLSLEHLIAHEFFHVYSRLNKGKRPDMYKIITYMPCEELVVPDELKDLMISNPDAPDNNFYITCDYKDQTYDFIPIIFSTEAYDIQAGGSFFRTLRDDMLAVTIEEGVPKPIYEEGQLLIVSKDDLTGFYDKIGKNTSYTYHPEETMADNFVLMLYESSVPNPEILSALKAVMED